MDFDDAYANADHIPRAADYPPRWAALAQAFRASLGDRARLGMSYGTTDRQALDLFLPEAAPRGTVIFIHGGYWRRFDRSFWSHLAQGPLARGWAVAMPSYDLCPEVRIAGITRQMAAAVTRVAGAVEGPIAITGHSAGGHLTARMLDPDLLPAAVAARIATAVPISPLSDLRPLRRTAMNADLRLDPAEALAESPVRMARRIPARVAVWVGAAERPAFLDQARWLSETWGIDMAIAPGRHHFDVIDTLTEPDSILTGLLTS